MARTIYTWGYRGRTVEDLRQVLREHRWPMVLDVRRRNSGERIACGWKAHTLEHSDPPLNYWPEPRLGNFGRTSSWIRGPEAAARLRFEADVVVNGARLLLMCAEIDAADCHRSEVAEAIAELVRAAGVECEVKHL